MAVHQRRTLLACNLRPNNREVWRRVETMMLEFSLSVVRLIKQDFHMNVGSHCIVRGVQKKIFLALILYGLFIYLGKMLRIVLKLVIMTP